MSSGLWLDLRADDDGYPIDEGSVEQSDAQLLQEYRGYDQDSSAGAWAPLSTSLDFPMPSETAIQPYSPIVTTWGHSPAFSVPLGSCPWYPLLPVSPLSTGSTQFSDSTQESGATQFTVPDDSSHKAQDGALDPTAYPCYLTSRTANLTSPLTYQDPMVASPDHIEAADDMAPPELSQYTAYLEKSASGPSQSTRRSTPARSSNTRRRSSQTEALSTSAPPTPRPTLSKPDLNDQRQRRQSRQRHASDKYRVKTQDNIKKWEAVEHEARTTNLDLSQQLLQLKNEVVTLRNEMLHHFGCEDLGIERYLAQRVHIVSHCGAREGGM